MIRRLYYVGLDVSTRYQSKPIQLPAGTRALRVKPDDLNGVLERAESSGYTRDEIKTAVDVLNELHKSGDRTFGDWQEAPLTGPPRSVS